MFPFEVPAGVFGLFMLGLMAITLLCIDIQADDEKSDEIVRPRCRKK